MPEVHPSAVSPNVSRVLEELVQSACEVLAEQLRAVVLFGSAAEGHMRRSSDVNLVFVLRGFARERVERLREPLAAAQAAVRLRPMFLLESEIEAAAAAFAVKFADILRRRRVLWGSDPFASLTVPRAAIVARLRQVLLNTSLRMRDAYLLRGARAEQLVEVIAESAGPLRAAAAAILELEGKAAASPREALARVAAGLPGGGGWDAILVRVSEAREQGRLAADVAGDTLFGLIELSDRMRERAAAMT